MCVFTMKCDPTPTVSRFTTKLVEEFYATAEKAIAKDILTDEERFAIAFAAGVPVTTQYQDGTFSMTTEPCAIVNVNRQWQIFRETQPQGDNS